jgi:hypothetical protein
VESFIRAHERQLEIICASEAYKQGQKTCSDATYHFILTEASDLINKHVRTYHGEAQTIAKGVASGVLGLAVSGNPYGIASYAASAGIDAGIGLFEATSSSDYVLSHLDGTIANTASNSLTASQIFAQKITKSYPSDVINILVVLQAFGFPPETSSIELPCTDIESIRLGIFEPKRPGITSSYEDVNSLFASQSSSAAKSSLSNSLKDSLLNRMRDIISTSFVQPTTNFAASAFTHIVTEHLHDHIKKMKAIEQAQQKATTKEEYTKQELQQKLKFLTKEQTETLQSHRKSQYAKTFEARKELEKITEQEAKGLITKTQAETQSQKIKEACLRDISNNYEYFKHDHPALADLAHPTLKSAAQYVLQPYSPQLEYLRKVSSNTGQVIMDTSTQDWTNYEKLGNRKKSLSLKLLLWLILFTMKEMKIKYRKI